jgi:hypothetical protein
MLSLVAVESLLSSGCDPMDIADRLTGCFVAGRLDIITELQADC